MTFTELKYIVALSQERHFGLAADKCLVSQPTLSVGIKKLEQELGVMIFERFNNQVILTQVGECIVEKAKEALNQMQVIRDIAIRDAAQLNHTLRIGAIYTIGPYLFPQLISALVKLAPNMPIFIEENFTQILLEKLQSGELDIIVVALPVEVSEIVVNPLYDDYFYAIVPNSHYLSNKDVLDVSDFIDSQMLVLGEGHCFRNQMLQSCSDIGIKNLRKYRNRIQDGKFANMIESMSLETIKYMVASGLGVSILPLSATYNMPQKVRIKPLKNYAKRTVALAWRSSFTRTKVIDVIKKAIISCDIDTQVITNTSS